ncbi:MAG TPA: hypothetical protein VMF65_22440 [Acidimicrobiales bacterium]|nr:hypothetical protein [Acidimicrobiales bacterium]HTW10016.1 hypothetical protein [Acidimicrobiales bacterium]
MPIANGPGLRARFWFEVMMASVTGFVAVLTLAWRDWIETVFGVDPDHGNGSLEWVVVAVLAIVTVALVAGARVEWRRSARPATEA